MKNIKKSLLIVALSCTTIINPMGQPRDNSYCRKLCNRECCFFIGFATALIATKFQLPDTIQFGPGDIVSPNHITEATYHVGYQNGFSAGKASCPETPKMNRDEDELAKKAK